MFLLNIPIDPRTRVLQALIVAMLLKAKGGTDSPDAIRRRLDPKIEAVKHENYTYFLPPVTINDERGIKTLWLSQPDGENLDLSIVNSTILHEELLAVLDKNDTSQLIISFEHISPNDNVDFKELTSSLIFLSRQAREKGKIVHLCHLPGKLYETMCQVGKLGPTGLTIHAPIQDALHNAHEIAYDTRPIEYNPSVPSRASLEVLAQVSTPKTLKTNTEFTTLFNPPLEVDLAKKVFVQFLNPDLLFLDQERLNVLMAESVACERACNRDYRKFLSDPSELRGTLQWSLNSPEIKHLILSFEGAKIEDDLIPEFFKIIAKLHVGRRDMCSSFSLCDLPENVLKWTKTDEGKEMTRYLSIYSDTTRSCETTEPIEVPARAAAAQVIEKNYFLTYSISASISA